MNTYQQAFRAYQPTGVPIGPFMLRIKRKAGESIIITTPDGDEILVIVDGFEGRAVRLSVHAAEHIKIDRMEIHNKRKLDERG